MEIISGSSNKPLAEAIAKILKVNLLSTNMRRFADKEIGIRIDHAVRDKDVFVIQPTSSPANENLMELLIILDALQRASARRITAVIPYYGYSRQDRKDVARTPITSKLVADLLKTAGADRVLTVDLHALQIQGFFSIKADNLEAAPIFVEHVKTNKIDDPVIVSPDAGGIVRARNFKEYLNVADLAVIDKHRSGPGKSEVMNIIGNVENRNCIIIDDIVDSAGTLCSAAAALKKAGANVVHAYITHGVLSGNAVEKIRDSQLDSLVITDTIELASEVSNDDKIKQVSIAPLIAEAVIRINKNKSLSGLFL